MPYSGGSSTNSGVRYQNWFLALQFSYAFFEQDYQIYPEALRSVTIKVDDIVVKTKGKDFFYSSKFRSPSKNLHWFNGDLSSQEVLLDFKKQLIATPNATITLISESNCYLFSEVFKRARNAIGSIDIHKKLNNPFAIKAWEKAQETLGYDDFEMIEFARRVNIRAIPIEEIENLVKHRFMHVTDQNLVSKLLFDKAVESSSYKTPVNKFTINNWFLEESISINSPYKQ